MKSLFLYLIFLSLLLNLVFSSCKHDCNGNGDCDDDDCTCYEDWTGSDCSVPYYELNDGESFTGEVEDTWVDFHTDVGENALTLTYHMEDNILGDCDLFVRYDAFPTHSHHDYENSGWGSSATIIVSDPQPGNWVIGVYNFVSCSFTLSVSIEYANTCPNDCSDNGICGDDNICICDDSHGGSDCSEEYVDLTNGDSYVSNVDHWTWDMYYYDVEDAISSIVIVVNQTDDNSGDSDLYVKFEGIPSLFDYDYRNAVIVDNYQLTIGNPSVGRYYIGIYGYRACQYTIQVFADDGSECPNQCSAHGYCSNTVCQCNPSTFEGEACEYMNVDIQEGQSISGYTENNQWNYYTATANSANNMVISIDQDWNVGGDCDLYVRADEYPDRFHYDYRDISYDDSFSLVIQNPLSTHWYIGVYGYRTCQYFISETLNANICPDDCSGNGDCQSGRCYCESGFGGINCGSPITDIFSTIPLSSTIQLNQWQYYRFTAPSVHTSISIDLLEENTEGYLGLYVLQGSEPELNNFDYSNLEITDLHSLYFLFDGTSNEDHDFYIGVYGTSLIPLGGENSYSIFVYSPTI